MGKITINRYLSEAAIQAIVQAELLNNPPASQLPVYPSHPSGFSDGQAYRNSTDGKMYVKENGTFKEIDLTKDSYEKILTSGTNFTILASEHNLETVSEVVLYDPFNSEVIVNYTVNIGLTININSDINLNNYKLKIFS